MDSSSDLEGQIFNLPRYFELFGFNPSGGYRTLGFIMKQLANCKERFVTLLLSVVFVQVLAKEILEFLLQTSAI
jgi:hypothetical protein